MAKGLEAQVKHPPAQAPALQTRQKVDVHVRGEGVGDPPGCLPRVVDDPGYQLIPTPALLGHGARISIEPPYLRPPARLGHRFEGVRVQSAKNVSANPLGVLGDEGRPRTEDSIGRDEHVAEDLGVGIEMRSVGARVPRRQTDTVEVL